MFRVLAYTWHTRPLFASLGMDNLEHGWLMVDILASVPLTLAMDRSPFIHCMRSSASQWISDALLYWFALVIIYIHEMVVPLSTPRPIGLCAIDSTSIHLVCPFSFSELALICVARTNWFVSIPSIHCELYWSCSQCLLACFEMLVQK